MHAPTRRGTGCSARRRIAFLPDGPLLGVSVPGAGGAPPLTTVLEQLLVQQRFFPIFSLLFGVGSGMLWDSASRRAARPRAVLLRRLLALGLLGALHQLLQAGEALLPCAIVGTLFLLPLAFLPERARTVVAGIGGAALTAVGATFGGLMLVPGMFLLGFTAASLDLPRRFERSARPGLALTVVAGAVAAPLRTPLRPVLAAVLAPLGRMTLTNHVSATLVIVVAGLTFSVPPQLVRGDAALVLDDAGMAAPVLLSRREHDGHEKVSTPPGPVLGTIVAVKWRPSRGPTARPSLPQ